MMELGSGVLIRTAGGAFLGALLGLPATSLLHGGAPSPFSAMVIVVAGVLVGVIAMASLTGVLERSRRRVQVPTQPTWGTPGMHSPSPTPSPLRAQALEQHPGGPAAPVAEAEAPQSTAVHVRNWWSTDQPVRDAGMEPPHAHVERARQAPPDVNAYGRTRRVVQCPECSSFAISLQQTVNGPDFTCAPCGRRWSWRPGRPWPAVTSGLPPRHAPSTDAS